MPPDKQEIASTRSFGRPITELTHLVEVVSEFSAWAAVKLRKQDGLAGRVLVFVHTSAFRARDRQYSNSITLSLRRPSADTAAITATAVRGMEAIYRTGFNYAKAGVMLLDIQARSKQYSKLADHVRSCRQKDRRFWVGHVTDNPSWWG